MQYIRHKRCHTHCLLTQGDSVQGADVHKRMPWFDRSEIRLYTAGFVATLVLMPIILAALAAARAACRAWCSTASTSAGPCRHLATSERVRVLG